MKLTPLGARRLLGIPLGELTGAILSLRDLLDPFTAGAAENLERESVWVTRGQVLDAALLRRQDDQSDFDPRIEWAWHGIVAGQGMPSISDLAEKVGWSQRHFIRSFHRELGLAPHKLFRIPRFNAVLPELRARRVGGASLAAGHGYAGQSPFDSRGARVHRIYSEQLGGDQSARRCRGGRVYPLQELVVATVSLYTTAAPVH